MSEFDKELKDVNESVVEKGLTTVTQSDEKLEAGSGDSNQGSIKETQVKRGLKPRHISMIAMGGTIGTGLFISISTPLVNAGPVGSLIAYIFMGSLAYMVTQSLGEMATFIPVTSSFMVFNQRFLSPALGAASGYAYFLTWVITLALELTTIGQVIQFWTSAVPDAAWIAIFWVVLTAANFVPVKFYGEVEFWVACIKVIAILGFIIYALCMVCGAGVTGPVGFRYWRNPGPWGDGIISNKKAEGRFLGWVSSLISAAFTYQGTELVGITAGEAANPRKTVPKAINKVFFRILFFYILSLFFIGLLVPFNDPKLSSGGSYISSSPFLIAIENSGTKVLPHIFNAVILTTLISAGNSDIYVASRILYSMACNGLAPPIFKWTTKSGIPYFSVLISTLFGFLAYLNQSEGAAVVFNWLLNITAVAGFFAWLLISIAHIRFMQALKFQGISRDDLPFKAKFMPWGAYYAAFFVGLIILIQGFTAFCPFNVKDFFAAYISVFLFFFFWAVFQLWKRECFFWKVHEIDLDTDRRDIENVIWVEEQPKGLWEKFWVAAA
ncbi:LAMI_0F02146g1_1 [Lachancea mirantina]|uniref:LAMI_0F02146g1_1 n=1 Tax=Lachancea mirantina TaxID=1230905 RepID=A0A1G4JWG6_9SACH|nr:LAMI_0F02146g1_1 [Lachancea mirantina]